MSVTPLVYGFDMAFNFTYTAKGTAAPDATTTAGTTTSTTGTTATQ
jgi:hypothetical protein